ncbi:MAG: LPXTG cell wall anchor domain-containing protein, partial [Oscillospiraceae bacterium]
LVNAHGDLTDYYKHQKADGTYEYVTAAGVPYGTDAVPQTGDSAPLTALAIILLLSLGGAIALIVWKKKHFRE